MPKKIKYKDLVIQTSGDFLRRPLPSNFNKMKDKKLFKFLEGNSWHPFEGSTPTAIWGLIEASADSWEVFLTGRGIQVTR